MRKLFLRKAYLIRFSFCAFCKFFRKSVHGLFGTYELIGNTKYRTFTTARHSCNIQRKHMAIDHIAFFPADSKITAGIAHRRFRMSEPVRRASQSPFMPVIKKIVMQQRPAYHRPTVGIYMKQVGKPQTHHRNGNGMLINADAPVLNKPLRKLHIFGA